MEEEKKSSFEDEIEKGIENWFEKKFSGKSKHKDNKCKAQTGAGAGVYFIGFIGAVVYYIGVATSFWEGVLGVLKAMVWPAFLIHGLAKFLNL